MLWQTIPSHVKTRDFVIIIIILLLFYEILFQKIDININIINNCTGNNVIQKINTELSHDIINLNRIKMFYLKNRDFFIPSNLKQKDWHNYTQIELDKQKVGIGEQGKAAWLPKAKEYIEKRLLSIYGYNAALSDEISLNRSLPDTRHKDCKKRLYLESLPTVTIIITYRNEYERMILRTIFSVLNRTPDQLVKEIFLINDASNRRLTSDFEFQNSKVKQFHVVNHSGLVTARLVGAKEATADVLVFLDSHTEANVNWLPPLLEPIALDYRTVVTPIIDRIEYDTLEYTGYDAGARGSFDWSLTYMRLPLTPKDKKNLPEPFETPVMLGGLFAISRRFFWELGGYDTSFQSWGGEQYELSFKIWQCGGRLLEAPCSRFGHIWRIFNSPEHDSHTSMNYRRVAEVWMDEYAKYVYARRPWDLAVDPGDLTEQKALRKKLKCKPFRWFMTQIAFDLTQQFPLVEHKLYGEGRIRPKLRPNLCVDGNHGSWSQPFVLRPCNSDDIPLNQNDQIFELTWYNDVKLKARYICWDLKSLKPGSHVYLYECHHSGGTQQWRYYEDMKRFVYIGYSFSLCLDHNPRNFDLFLSFCDNKSVTQLWEIDTIYKDQMAKWNVINSFRVTGPLEEWKE